MFAKIQLWAIIILMVLLIISAGIGGVFFLKYHKEKNKKEFFESLHNSNISYADKHEFKKAIDTLGLPEKTKFVQEVNHVNIRNEVYVKTILKDSVVRKACIDWTDGYSSLIGCFSDSVKSVRKDTLDIVLVRKPTKWFLGIFGHAKKDSLVLHNKDPHAFYKIKSFRRLKK